MTKEDVLHDLAEREGICHFDGNETPRKARETARRQVLKELMDSGLKDFEALRAIREAQQ